MTSASFLESIGLCPGDPRAYDYINSGIERLLYDPRTPEQGWIGGWAEMAFLVSKENPFITCPRHIAELIAIDGCNRPIPLSNQFSEYLVFGDGRFPKMDRWRRNCEGWQRQGFTRNYAATFVDISNPPQQIQIFPLNQADTQPNPQTGAVPRVFLGGIDADGNIVTSQDNNQTVQGEFVTLTWPYAMSVNSYSSLDSIQKDQTQGPVQFWQSDPIWGVAKILSVMEPTETTAWYRRYYIHGLPRHCCPAFRPIIVNQQPPQCDCPPEPQFVMVTGLAKLDLVPAQAQTDYLLIQSKEAVILAAQAVRMSRMDDLGSKQQAKVYHDQAINLLKGMTTHREGKNQVSTNFAPFGRYGWDRVNLSMK
jgi:hypothetical protein